MKNSQWKMEYDKWKMALSLVVKTVSTAELIRNIGDLDFDDAVGITRIDLFDEITVQMPASNYRILYAVIRLQGGIERKENLVPRGDVSLGLPCMVDATAFEVTKIADVVGRQVLPHAPQRRLALFRQGRVFLEKEVEADGPAVVPFTPDTEVA